MNAAKYKWNEDSDRGIQCGDLKGEISYPREERPGTNVSKALRRLASP